MSKYYRIIITMVIFFVAILAVVYTYHFEINKIWTRDGRIKADIVTLSSEVSGRVISLHVIDNQRVKKGELLWEIDANDYSIALQRSEKQLLEAKYQMIQLQQKASRRERLGQQAISREDVETAKLDYQSSAEKYQSLIQDVAQAKLQLQRTKVYSPVNGYVTNLIIQQGDYLNVGQNNLTLVNEDSFYIYGYFQENQIPDIHPGQQADITLLNNRHTKLTGKVESIARGITDYSNSGQEGQLHDVNPTFDWVRLPMRIPVRIRIDPKSIKNTVLVSGMTCTVSLQ